MKLTENEQAHRHGGDNQNVKYKRAAHFIGQGLGFALGIVIIIAVGFCAYIDQPWVASVLGGVATAGIVTAFVKGRPR